MFLLKRFLTATLILGLSLTVDCSPRGGRETFRPNILLIVMDAARADHFSCYGYQRRTTPNIDRVAAEGLRFSRAIASSSWTLPSHASLFTGLLVYEHGTHRQHAWLLDRFPTLAELLKTRGYRTAGFSNNPQVDRAHNLDRGFDIFKAVWSDTNKLVRRFLELHDPQKAPFFIFINYMDAHNPYVPPEPHRSSFLDPNRSLSPLADSANYHPLLVNKGQIKLGKPDYDTLLDLYDGSMNYLDARIGELLDYLEDRGLYDSTLVIITSDHGELFGEHGLFTHGVLLYWRLLNIPLIIRHPELVPEPAVRDNPVAIADIFHTLTRLVGVESGAATTGAPVSHLFGPEPVPKACYSEVHTQRIAAGPLMRRNTSRSLFTARGLHFIFTEQEAHECYDPGTDPDELRNLCPADIKKPEVVAAVTGFESKLELFTESLKDLRSSRPSRIDRQHEAALRALGYVGGSTAGKKIEKLSWHGREHFNTGVFHFDRRKYDLAREEFNKTLIIDPDYRPAHVALGQLLFREKRDNDALEHFLKISSKFPGDPEIQRLTTVLYALNGKPEQAERIFRRLVALYPGTAPKFFNQQGNMFLRSREPEPALILFDLLRHSFPEVAAYKKGYQDALRLKKKSQGS